MPTVTVVGTSPLPGLGVPLDDVPANVQMIKGSSLGDQHDTRVTDFLERNVTSVNINSEQGNADQQSVTFRGFYASPILGVPQGLSVFQDGVRINETFGDVVNWDLIAPTAISSMQLVPGSNPLYGLNTLGGRWPSIPRVASNTLDSALVRVWARSAESRWTSNTVASRTTGTTS
ncbi:TonB-dependent receptor plug domain-containing protein [Rhodoferax sediminis]|uniref:Plug domain-containing protein n=1 Tax=Rhodoferax sediminis TaxID=2509614 RepID=A0A515D9B8_9BURK|nr:Plug domain-containing protein [Rhodoferax sediminis]QDL37007.1 Plug domain-containing protein [Rhodoferax sediminis]